MPTPFTRAEMRTHLPLPTHPLIDWVDIVDPQISSNTDEQADLDTAEGDIDTLQSQMTTALSDIATLQGQMTAVQSDVDDNRDMLQMKVSEVSSATYTVQAGDTLIRADSSSNAVEIELPEASDAFDVATGVGRMIIIKRVNTGINLVTIVVGIVGDLIDGLTNISLASQFDVRRVVSNGTSWDVV